MPFIPHTEADLHAMLKVSDVNSIDELFKEIPKNLQIDLNSLTKISLGISEQDALRLMHKKAEQDTYKLNFIGGGSYEHYIPAAIWDIAGRGEYLTSYTPYQAEASQGTLQLLYEYQSMIVGLMQMNAANASLYEGASALAEAILMAVRCTHKKHAKKILLLESVSPLYREVVFTIVKNQEIELINVPFDIKTGKTDISKLQQFSRNELIDVAALVIPSPNFFGVIEDADELTQFAKKNNILVIGVVNPIAMALLKPPGAWGMTAEHSGATDNATAGGVNSSIDVGADIVCGEGQPLGVPLSSGGPYFGFICCNKKYLRQLPGRIIGRTTDVHGKDGFVLTLQAREQHIRRSKATSNICTNQGLLVTAATIYMSLLGFTGLKNVALACHKNKNLLQAKLSSVPNIEILFSNNKNTFHEFVIKFKQDANLVLSKLSKLGILGGISLEKYYPNYPEFKNCILCCVTETKTEEDLDQFVEALAYE